MASSGRSRLSSNDWKNLGTGAGIAVAVVLALSYLFGGYVAGRMARRGGVVNGLFVFFLGVVVAGGVAAVVGTQTDSGSVVRNLRNVGVPTSGKEWSHVGTVAGVAALLAMLVGAVVGGILGERWHAKLAARAADPTIGPDAEARRREAQVLADSQASGSSLALDEGGKGPRRSEHSPPPSPRGAISAPRWYQRSPGDRGKQDVADDESHPAEQ